ncbi:UDP-N-acetylglucosamine 4,6-dehydratase family protein [Cytobacillus oceanisediminis]|uniref:UDP-N-acetylglucosamine 4,6-dehydratase family protein n=1 Tax=Cytobacillus oceanisediminis TaxID=665099 RepID=UPI001D15237D|nr:UDP-N-acetylglucosamine 4,6-dehydratase family protein [Cytobacillus oceanisediminis]
MSFNKEIYNNKTILVTGGTGSIGMEIVKLLLSCNPRSVRVFSRDESKQFFMQEELKNYENIRYFVGDIRDKQRLLFALDGVDYVFHAAALKHVPSCEYNPFEAVKTNVLGVQNLIEASLEKRIKKVIVISTDKVVNPINTMGTTKLLSEKLVAAADYYKGANKTVFACVRFGNVMGSRGSVIPLFKEQITSGEPITLTDKKMTRFIMSISQASNLVLKAAEYAIGGELFILKMPTIRIIDLAEVLIEDYESATGQKGPGIQEVGIRPGEKIFEELMTLEESKRALCNDEMFIIPSIVNQMKDPCQYYGFRIAKDGNYSSENAPRLNKKELLKLLQTEHLTFD